MSGANDVAEYRRLARKEGLKVIHRPGPCACAEWDFGGFPWWLLKHPDIRLRTRDVHYLDTCRRYLTEVGRQLAPLQVTRGGPIIMVQVENEYGSYGNDRDYVGQVGEVSGLRYLPRQDMPNGRIKEFRVFLSEHQFTGLAK